MANGNPFYVKPAIAYDTGLKGIQAGIDAFGNVMARAEQAKQEQALKDEMANLMSNPETTAADISAFAIQNPKAGEFLRKQIQFKDDTTQDIFNRTLGSVLATEDPNQRRALMQQGARAITAAGGNPENLLGAVGDVEQQDFNKGAMLALSATPQGQKILGAYQEMQPEPVKPVKDPEKQRLFNVYKQLPEGPDKEAFGRMIGAIAKAPQTQITVGGEQSTFQKELGKGFAQDYLKLQKEGKDATRELTNIKAMEALSKRAFAGRLAGVEKEIKSIADYFGADVEGLSETEALTALSNKLTADATKALSGALSEKELDFIQKSVPQLNQSREGRQLIMDIAKAAAKERKRKASYARKYRKEKKTFDDDFESWYAERGGDYSSIIDRVEFETGTKMPKDEEGVANVTNWENM